MIVIELTSDITGKFTDTELTALGFTRQSKSMWRKGDATYQNGKFYRNGKEITREEALSCK